MTHVRRQSFRSDDGQLEDQHSDCSWVMSLATMGEYRLRAMSVLQERLNRQLCIYAGARPYDASIRVLTPADLPFTELRSWYARHDILLQGIPWRRYLSSDCLLLDLNPRVPHIWILVVLRRLLRRRTILWGHAWPRAGRESASERVRRALRALSSAVVVYTHTQGAELQSAQPGLSVFVAPNALYTRAEMGFDDTSPRFRILYVGRLVAEKKPELLLHAFELSAASVPDARLTFVGDGPLSDALAGHAKNSPFHERIEFLGHISEVTKLKSLYSEATVTVSPGYVGLSATQSFGFGVPMLISADEPHSPEIEAARPGENCLFFPSNDARALASTLVAVWGEKAYWRSRGSKISADCAATYSVERMVDGLIDAFAGRVE